jgi:hypothetical protein
MYGETKLPPIGRARFPRFPPLDSLTPVLSDATFAALCC